MDTPTHEHTSAHLPRRFPILTQHGAHVSAFYDTISGPQVRCRAGHYQLLTPGTVPVVLFSADASQRDDTREVDWLDFTIELLAGLTALITGIRIGKDGYLVLKPITEALWEYPAVREHVRAVGEQSLTEDALATGQAVIVLWRFLWAEHRRTIFQGMLKAIGRSMRPRILLEAVIRWMARMVSAGIAFTVELGLLALPLRKKLLPPD